MEILLMLAVGTVLAVVGIVLGLLAIEHAPDHIEISLPVGILITNVFSGSGLIGGMILGWELGVALR